jgi:NADH:ubiquinone oxidoreductase subunit 6 (subunit J)
LVLFDYGLIGSGRRIDVRSLVREIKLDISEFTTDVIRKLGTVLYSKYFFAIMLGLLVLIVGCIIVSV